MPPANAPPADRKALRALIRALPGPDRQAEAKAAAREPALTKPPGALARLEDLSRWAAAWQGRHPARVRRIAACVFAGNHGVVARGVSAFPAQVTRQMVANFEAGGAAINQFCAVAGAKLKVVALALDKPTADFTQAPAMTEREFFAALAAGWRAVPAGIDVLCPGEMGIGNTTAAAAICGALFGGTARDWTGPGTGVKGTAMEKKIRAVAAGVRRHRPAVAADPLEALRLLGGREMAAILGAVLAARMRRIPVILDGFVCTAAVAALALARRDGLAHCVVGHVSAEPGHRRLLQKLGQAPLLDLGMRLGEGTGAVLAAGILRAACAAHAGMATFAEAAVSGRKKG
ncbi:MAG: nicotinate-nucleotide--dimethylbenzimidazole phosphoribosyltransferase [Alphaproteobacteria bacterium]|nr:nicotinate-nucleotide--dimethylbenzimidazole phosphoribosyltransferase [Alphaproteobacteria bacterium]